MAGGTHRIVLLVDLDPLLLPTENPNPNPNPSSYLAAVVSAATSLLSSSRTSSLSASRLFFSSLSPFLSSSLLPKPFSSPSSLSFHLHPSTLSFLSSLSPSHLGPTPPHAATSSSAASSIAKSLLQLEHDYGWEAAAAAQSGAVPSQTFSNLVVLFSPVSEFGGFGQSSCGIDGFLKRFREVFGPVRERLVCRGIHVCWVGVNWGLEEEGLGLDWVARGVRELGWGFSTTDAIALGSALVPPPLVFPCAGCGSGRRGGGGRAELVLEIADVEGKPLECRSCELEVLDVKRSGGKIAKIHVKGVCKVEEGDNAVSNDAAFTFLVRGCAGDGKKEARYGAHREFFPDRVLELLLGAEKDQLGDGKPIWQLLLVFLHRRRSCAVVSISDADGKSVDGFLVPFSINYALLHVLEKRPVRLGQLVAKSPEGSQEAPDNCISDATKEQNARKKRSKLLNNLLQTTTWSAFREVLLGHADGSAPVIDLEDLYFNRYGAKSKKLRFLKCWMKQVKQSCYICNQSMHTEAEKHLPVKDEAEVKFGASEEDVAAPHASSSMDDAGCNRLAGEESSFFSCMEDLEAFLGSVPQKIEQGLHSEDADLGTLAERLVCLSIRALLIKHGRIAVKYFEPKEEGDASDAKIASEVSNLLLRKPKELVSKYKDNDSASTASVQASPKCSTEYKIREHELQILLRMEVIKSEVGVGVEEGIKQKMIKEICSLLQFIDINLQGDSFQPDSIVEFAEKTIKSRYKHSMGDVIKKIYTHMEFDLFDEEVECSDSLPSSNHDDFNIDRGRNHRNYPTASGSAPHLRHDKHEEQLMRAQERRNRDRRLSSFTSWVPDLHRVWALKHPRKERAMQVPRSKPSKRRKRRVAYNDMVCETPMTAKKQQHEQDSACGESKSLGSISKALFHDEADLSSGSI